MFLAIDAGGTSTRAVCLDPSGRVHGYGRSGGGNPTASGIEAASASVAAAAAGALGSGGHRVDRAVLAMAGEKTTAYADLVASRLAALGVASVSLDHDLLAIYCSGTHLTEGYALIAGTGTVAARVRDGLLDRVVGGRGWLIGDTGSGFWIGQRIARAVILTLDGQAPPTALTAPVLDAYGIADAAEPLPALVSAVYARPPVQLAGLAPLAFTAGADPVAREIRLAAVDALLDLLDTVRLPGLDGPVVIGGSVVVHGVLGDPELAGRLAAPTPAGLVPVADGVVGAAVLALRRAGIDVDAALFTRVRDAITAAPLG